ncbi:hypothetical protein ACPPVO_47535 [Dactylosporangium sp. McL0621]|uniref:hypothetical protein n=1 Tax=Dactylosporangium sp. McL0621 TaxID=3415678 RepID=UPI003CF5E3BC
MSARSYAGWRIRMTAGIAVAATIGLLALPTPGAGTPSTAPSAAASGPATLAGTWPDARTIDLPATLPDGTTYTPAAVLDPHRVVVQIADADPDTASLALLDPADLAHPRRLEAIPIAGGGSFDTVTTDPGWVYWMSSVAGDQGSTRGTLHRADATGHTATLTTDTGHATFTGSMYDLQVADGRIWWTATRGTTVPTTDLRSTPLTGGKVTVRPLQGTYHLTGWPWAGDDRIGGQPVVQLNLTTGAQRTFTEPPGQDVYCGAVWCRTVVRPQQATVVTLRRTDGTGQTARINTDGEVPVFTDIAATDRFEFLTAPISTQAATTSERLSLYDLNTSRRVAIAVSTAEGLNGTWLWWATGDNETMTWHLLDLATLR